MNGCCGKIIWGRMGNCLKDRGQRADVRCQRAESMGGEAEEDRGHPGEMRSAVVNEFHRVKRSENKRQWSRVGSQRTEDKDLKEK